jgi:hypothetical protein
LSVLPRHHAQDLRPETAITPAARRPTAAAGTPIALAALALARWVRKARLIAMARAGTGLSNRSLSIRSFFPAPRALVVFPKGRRPSRGSVHLPA